ncbi:hypothetical protein [Micromonospora noduli]|nr:hypothetical protein [Micromonospora noduli]
MSIQSDALPVLVIDGASFVDFAGFVREFSQLRGRATGWVYGYEWCRRL